MARPHLARVLVTGASGTLGYNIVRHLAAAHPETHLHLLMRAPDPTLFQLNVSATIASSHRNLNPT